MASRLVAVAFSDVVSSTELWTTLGDARADDVRRRLRVASEASVEAVGGVVVKDLGDGLMVTFPTASASIDGAVALQRAAAGVAPCGRPNRSYSVVTNHWPSSSRSAPDSTRWSMT